MAFPICKVVLLYAGFFRFGWFFNLPNGVAMYVFLNSDGFFNLQSGVAMCVFLNSDGFFNLQSGVAM